MAVRPRPKPAHPSIFPAAVRLLAVAFRFKVLLCAGPPRCCDDQGNFETKPRLLAELRNREFRQTVTALSKELGMPYGDLGEGEHISGVYRKPVDLGSGKFAVIEKSHEFTLVPWRPELERFRNKSISIAGGGPGRDWEITIGRKLGLGL
jgi:hypothetical protein